MDYSDAIKRDDAISSKLTESEIDEIFTPQSHLGAAPQIITNVSNTVSRVCKKFI